MNRIAWSVAGWAALAAACQAAEPAGVLVEAEAYTSKVSEHKDFASSTREPAASGRRVLFRFFQKGHVVYTVRVPKPGRYTVWLRYGAKKGQTIGVAIDPKGEPRFARVTLPATGGYVGKGVWGWSRLATQPLPAGEHRLAISSASMRVDCLYLTTSQAKPKDELVLALGPKKVDPKTQALLDKPLSAVRPDWLDGVHAYRLPAWFDRYRVHLHTRLGPRWVDKPIFFTAAEAFRQMGVHTFARHIKSGAEGAWWPSKVGAVLPAAEDRNIAKEIIDNAHKIGSRILVYHRHMEDDWAVKTHPDWAARDWRGQLVKKRGHKACFNSPYADFVQTRLLELVDLGADAFYFDEVHMPKAGCWCSYCKRRFKQATGLDHPAEPDPFDPVWQKLVDFNNRTIEQVFLKWRKAIHARNPEVVMLVGSNTYPTMAERHMTHRLFRIADSMKTEFSLPARGMGSRIFQADKTIKPTVTDVRLALGYALSRDATDGRPPHVWTHGLLNEASCLYATAGMVTHGCIANLDVSEKTIPNMMFKPAFELGDKVSPYFAGTRPVRWAAVHYSEHARDRYAMDESAKWKTVIYPTYGAFHVLLRARLPVGVVTDSQLEEGRLAGCKLLFLPAPQHLTEPMRRAVDAFKAAGGTVVEQRETWLWHDAKGGQDKAFAAFGKLVAPLAAHAPVQAFGGPEKMHAVAFTDPGRKRLTVSLCNDFSWVYTGRRRTRDGKEIDVSGYLKPPPPCRGVHVEIRDRRRPKRVFDAVTGKTLTGRPTANGMRIDVPTFEHMAVVVAQYE